jgi:hypothetical protein
MTDMLGQPGPGEALLWEQLDKLGVGPEKTFNPESLSAQQLAALQVGIKQAMADMESFIKQNSNDPLASGKWFGTRKFLEKSANDNYPQAGPDMVRTVAAHMGLYGNSAAEATYPTYLTDADGEPLNAAQYSYTVTFPKGSLPPVKAFWSLTMYDGQSQLLVDNALDRYLLNSSMLEQLQWQEDGSLVLYVGKDSPGEALESNWLPAPDGPFYMVLRLYGPEDAALTGDWMPPQAKRR